MIVRVTSFLKHGKTARSRAKATVRYLAHRPDMAGKRQSRTLFNGEGPIERIHAYQLIDQARKGSVFYRLTISPDPKSEDIRRDLDLWGLTQSSLRELKVYLRRGVAFIAAVHDDHTKNRHVNLLLIVPGRLTRQDFRAFPVLSGNRRSGRRGPSGRCWI